MVKFDYLSLRSFVLLLTILATLYRVMVGVSNFFDFFVESHAHMFCFTEFVFGSCLYISD